MGHGARSSVDAAWMQLAVGVLVAFRASASCHACLPWHKLTGVAHSRARRTKAASCWAVWRAWQPWHQLTGVAHSRVRRTKAACAGRFVPLGAEARTTKEHVPKAVTHCSDDGMEEQLGATAQPSPPQGRSSCQARLPCRPALAHLLGVCCDHDHGKITHSPDDREGDGASNVAAGLNVGVCRRGVGAMLCAQRAPHS